jgi:hypothetical protein
MLANFIYTPSYLRFETALFIHQLIPEGVYPMTSVSSKRSRDFQTSFGVFSYQSFPLKNFFVDVEWREDSGHKFLVAKPWEAICDYIFFYKKNWICC